MNIHYSILFTLEILHEYYSNNKSDDFDVKPSADTEMLFRKMGVLWRKTGSRCVALINAKKKGETVYVPAINTESKNFFRADFGNQVMRFYLTQKTPSFLNFTNLPIAAAQTLYFSNLAANEQAGWMYLSRPVAAHTNNTDYIPGNLVSTPGSNRAFEAVAKHKSVDDAQLSNNNLWQQKGLRFLAKPLKKFIIGKVYQQGEFVTDDGGSNVFESLKTATASNVADLADPALWKQRGEGDLQYPSSSDLVAVSSGQIQVTLTVPAKKATIQFFSFNYSVDDPKFDVPAAAVKEKNFTNEQSVITVETSHLPPGRYLIDVNGDTKLVYYDPALAGGTVFGVIEIFSHLLQANDYAFLTDTEEIRQRDYSIQFPARSVLWKYKRKDGRAATITDKGSTGYAFTPSADAFVSSRPIPFSEETIDTLELSFSDTANKLFPLPNPPANRLGRTLQNDFAYPSAELFLNY